MMRAECLRLMVEFVKAVKAPILEMTVVVAESRVIITKVILVMRVALIILRATKTQVILKMEAVKVADHVSIILARLKEVAAKAMERVTKQLAQKAIIAAMGNSLVVDLLAMYILTLATVTLHAATQPILGVTVLEQASLVYHPSLLSLSPKKRES